MSTGHCPIAINHQPHYCVRTSGQLFLFGETEDAKESHGRLWKNISITQIQFIQLILWVNIFGEVGIANIYILLPHFIISQCKYTYQGCVPTCSNYGEKLILELECGKPCQISNQHHCHHHHYHCQPTLSSPKSFQYKTYIFYFADILTPEPTKSYRWLSNKGWQVRLISLSLDTVYLPQQVGTFPPAIPYCLEISSLSAQNFWVKKNAPVHGS